MTQAKQFRYGSDIAEQTLKLKPDAHLPVLEAPCNCSHCGRMMEVGEQYENTKVGEFFSDTRDLASTSRKACWRCVWLRKRHAIFGMAATVATPDELYPIAKDIHKAWIFTQPPPAPFIVTHSSATMQHLAWRTPVTTDNRMIMVRFGPHLYRVRPELVNQALAIADAHNEGQKTWRSPLYLDRKAQAPDHGVVTHFGREALSASELRFFQNELSNGERWALSYLMHSKRPVAEVPEPITQTILERLEV